MTTRKLRVVSVLVAIVLLGLLGDRARAKDKVLFDFEDEAELKSWTQTPFDLREAARQALSERLARVKGTEAPVHRKPASEPTVKLALTASHATSGKHCLELTYSGGKLPTVGTDKVVVDDWSPYKTFRADVFASRTCVVVFRVMREKSRRDEGWDGAVSRYEKVCRLEAGDNHVVELTYAKDFDGRGKIVRFEISMHAPKDGESIYVNNVAPVERTAHRHHALQLHERPLHGRGPRGCGPLLPEARSEDQGPGHGLAAIGRGGIGQAARAHLGQAGEKDGRTGRNRVPEGLPVAQDEASPRGDGRPARWAERLRSGPSRKGLRRLAQYASSGTRSGGGLCRAARHAAGLHAAPANSSSGGGPA